MSKPSTHLSVSLQHRVGTIEIAASFTLTRPWSVLFGPSGAGKTTILRAVAGLVHPEAATISRGDGADKQFLTDTASKIFLPPRDRNIGLVVQRPALFPHLSAAENVAFGLQHQLTRQEISHRVEELLALFQANHLAARRPSQLSGGEAQRVALARALAPKPKLLLLDEPFTGLDIALKQSLIDDLRTWIAQTQTPVLMVTHSLSEVFLAGAEVLVLENGKVKAQGEAALVLAEQRALLLEQLGREAL
ncbi:MAG: ATP-binding cassette domain-containing protein [Acidobacteriaceae bacterium]